MRDALAAIESAEKSCLDEWWAWAETLPQKTNAVQRERTAYLRGRLAGLDQARRALGGTGSR